MNPLSILADPVTGKKLRRVKNTLEHQGRTVARQSGEVWSFHGSNDDFYEGAYLNRTHYVPSKDNLLGRLPYLFITNGYVWEVSKQFPPGSRIVELGCASGVDYLARRYKMIGVDVSMASLNHLNGYSLALQANAESLPLEPNSLDGVISSYFWEHIPPESKDRILASLYKALRPGGKIVFLYDVATSNGLISAARKKNPDLYAKRFIDHDGHLGYETVEENHTRFEANGFRVERQIGMERTWVLSTSVYKKLCEFRGWTGVAGKVLNAASRGAFRNYANIAAVRAMDMTIGRAWPIQNSRILMTVATKVSK